MKVKKVAQSPLNPERWCIILECGHEVWVTSKRWPQRKTEKCPHCERPQVRK